MSRCIFILSIRSCGSSVLQRKLAGELGARVMEKTPHNENETLFWTKAASALRLPQDRLEKSDVPFSRRRAVSMLRTMIAENTAGHQLGSVDESAIFEAWTAIVTRTSADFVEKSPEHLYEPAALRLMERYADRSAVDVRFIGLVRNPTDTLYSSWRRFGIVPEREERHWLRSYEELLRLQERRPGQVSVVRYEDLVGGAVAVDDLLGGFSTNSAKPTETLHDQSVGKWRGDHRFGYTPSDRALELGRRYGYGDQEMVNPLARPWLATRLRRRAAHGIYFRLPSALRARAGGLIKGL